MPSAVPQPRGLPVRQRAAACILAAAVVVIAGCGVRIGGTQSLDRVTHNLRRENASLRDELAKARSTISAQNAQIQALQQGRDQSQPPSPAPPGGAPQQQALPRVASIALGAFSSLVDTTADGRPDLARIYLRTLDQSDRFIPVAGTVQVQILRLQGDQPPQVIAEKSFSREELDAAYRSGLAGTHYTLEIPLQLGQQDKSVTVAIKLTDAATGVMLSTTGQVK